MTKPHKMKGLGVFEIAMCENPANEGSRVVLFKSNPRAAIMKYMGDLVGAAQIGAQNFDAIFQRAEAERKRWQASEELWPAFSALQESLRSIASDASLDQAGKIARIGESVTQFLAAVKEKLPDVEQELAKALSAVTTKAEERTGDQQEEGSMPGEADKVTALETQVADLNKSIATLTKAKDDAEKERDAAKKDAEDAKKAIEVAKTDETFEAEGQTIRKSVVGDSVFAVMKAQNDRLELATFEKSAEGIYKALPGEPIAKAKALRSIAKAGTEDDRKVINEMLKAGAEAQATLMKATGAAGSNKGGGAEAQIEALAKKHMADHKTTFAKAYDAVLDTDEGRSLYKAMYQERRAA